MTDTPSQENPGISLTQGRLCIFVAAVLWSLGSFFAKILYEDTWFQLNHPKISPEQIAFYRLIFAGLILTPLLRRQDLSFQTNMIWMVLCFAAMNWLYVKAMTEGKASTAILLQYTAPIWMYLAGIFVLKEALDRRSTIALFLGLAGIAVIVVGGWENEQPIVIAYGVASGMTYGCVLLFLRTMRSESSVWLTIWNHLGAALLLAPAGLVFGLPSASQLVVLAIYGAVQMGIPYWLMARGLRVVSPQEAAAVTLIEPILNPIWAYLVSPDTETLSPSIAFGGIFIIGGLAYRYWPRGRGEAE